MRFEFYSNVYTAATVLLRYQTPAGYNARPVFVIGTIYLFPSECVFPTTSPPIRQTSNPQSHFAMQVFRIGSVTSIYKIYQFPFSPNLETRRNIPFYNRLRSTGRESSF